MSDSSPPSGPPSGGTSLSVGPTTAVRHGHPLMGIALIAGVVIAIGALVGALLYVARPHDARDARAAATAGFKALVAAERGRQHACTTLLTYVDGDHATERRACQALVGDDPGVHVHGLHAGRVHLAAERGTVHLSGTVVDARGDRPLSLEVPMSDTTGMWLIAWDGASMVRPR